MNARERAVAEMERQFGIGAPGARVALSTNSEARAIYECAIRALTEAPLPGQQAMCERLDKALQDRGIFSVGFKDVIAIVNELRKP